MGIFYPRLQIPCFGKRPAVSLSFPHLSLIQAIRLACVVPLYAFYFVYSGLQSEQEQERYLPFEATVVKSMDSTVRLPGFKCSICHHENLMRV
jgi:hypothetical protein